MIWRYLSPFDLTTRVRLLNTGKSCRGSVLKRKRKGKTTNRYDTEAKNKEGREDM